MKCVLCEEGTVTEVQETFMFSPRGYVPNAISDVWVAM